MFTMRLLWALTICLTLVSCTLVGGGGSQEATPAEASSDRSETFALATAEQLWLKWQTGEITFEELLTALAPKLLEEPALVNQLVRAIEKDPKLVAKLKGADAEKLDDDNDQDGFLDLIELLAGTDPDRKAEAPTDADLDGVPDVFQIKGLDGLFCWDDNGDGQQDLGEDRTGDGQWNAADCRGNDGLPGASGASGAQGLPGAPGTSGPQGDQGFPGHDGASIVFAGEVVVLQDLPVCSPDLLLGYYRVGAETEAEYYYCDGSSWRFGWRDGKDGIDGGPGLVFLGTLESPPSEPLLNWAYYNRLDRVSYLYDGTTWQVLARDGADGISLTWKGELPEAPQAPELNWIYYNTTAGRSYLFDGASWVTITKDGLDGEAAGGTAVGIVWKGTFAAPIPDPLTGWAYYDSTEKKSFIWDGTAWRMIAMDGSDGLDGNDGVSLFWQGSQASPPPSPEPNWAYYDTDDKTSYVWTGTQWSVLVRDGLDGTQGPAGPQGDAGLPIVWKGNLVAPPADPGVNWAYRDLVNGASYIFDGTTWDLLARDGEGTVGGGTGIVWIGTFNAHPASPEVGWAYYNEVQKRSYVFDGTLWNVMSMDGLDGINGLDGTNGLDGAQGPAGPNGLNGLSCWDLNGNGEQDLVLEDSNDDGLVDVWDCREASESVSSPEPLLIANAGPDLQTRIWSYLLLDGRNSFVLGTEDPIHYEWFLLSQPAGSTATFQTPNRSTTAMLLIEPGTYTLGLRINDGTTSSQLDTLTVTVSPYIGGTQALLQGCSLNPISTSSIYEPVAVNTATYSSFAKNGFGEDGKSPLLCSLDDLEVVYKSDETATVTFHAFSGSIVIMADKIGYYVLRHRDQAPWPKPLLQTGGLHSLPILFVGMVDLDPGPTSPEPNTPPSLTFEPAYSGPIGEVFTLTPRSVVDSDGDQVTLTWNLSTQPAGSTLSIVEFVGDALAFTPIVYGDYVFTVVADDGGTPSTSATVTVTIEEHTPRFLEPPVDRTINLFEPFSSTYVAEDLDGDPVTFRWTLVGQPAGSGLEGSIFNGSTLHFTPLYEGAYVFEVELTDGVRTSEVLRFTLTAAYGWSMQVIDATNATDDRLQLSGGFAPVLRLDDDGQPTIVYYHHARSTLYRLRRSGGVWDVETVSTDPLGKGGFSYILTSDGTPFVAWYDATTEALRVGRRLNGAWLVQTIDATAACGRVNTMVETATGVAVVYTADTSNALRVAQFDGTSWSTSTARTFSRLGDYVFFRASWNTVGQALVLYYQDPDTGRVMSASSTTAYTPVVLDANHFRGNFLDLGVDGDGKIGLCYFSPYEGLYYATNAGGAWASTSIDSAAKSGFHCAVSFDAENDPTVHYSLYAAGSGDDVNTFHKAVFNAGWSTTTLSTDQEVHGFDVAVDDASSSHLVELRLLDHRDIHTGALYYDGVRILLDLPTSHHLARYSSAFLDQATGSMLTAWYEFEQGATNRLALKFAGIDAGQVTVETIVAPTLWTGSQALSERHYPQVVQDASGDALVVALDPGSDELRLYRHTVPGQWETQVIATLSTEPSYSAILHEGRLAVAYYLNDSLNLAVYNGQSFSTTCVDYWTDTGRKPVLVSAGGRLEVYYFDTFYASLKRAVLEEGLWYLETVDEPGYDPDQSLVTASVDGAGEANLFAVTAGKFFDFTNDGSQFHKDQVLSGLAAETEPFVAGAIDSGYYRAVAHLDRGGVWYRYERDGYTPELAAALVDLRARNLALVFDSNDLPTIVVMNDSHFVRYKKQGPLPEFFLASSLTGDRRETSVDITLDIGEHLGVSAWCVNESVVVPMAGDLCWTTTKPTLYHFQNTTNERKTVYLWVKDLHGAVVPSSISRQISFDSVPPDTFLDETPAAFVSLASTAAEFVFSSDETEVSFLCSLDGEAYEPCTSPIAYRSELAAETHTFAVKAVDPAGNADATPAQCEFTVVSPETTLDATPAASVALTSGQTLAFSFSGDGPDVTFRCMVDGTADAPCTSPTVLNPYFQVGNHTFAVTAYDPAGNADPSPAEFIFEVTGFIGFARSFATATEYRHFLTVDSVGNLYLLGKFTGTVNFAAAFGDVDERTAVATDLFVTRINADGSYGWTRTLQADYSVDGGSPIVANLNGVYLTGGFEGIVDFATDFGSSDVKTSAGYKDLFVTYIGGDGSYGWTKQVLSAEDAYGSAITIDTNGNLNVAGTFMGTVDFGAGFGGSDSKQAYFYAASFTKLTSEGGYLWTRIFKYNSSSYPVQLFGKGFVADVLGDVYLAFSAANAWLNITDLNVRQDFGANAYASMQAYADDLFLVKAGAGGTYTWFTQHLNRQFMDLQTDRNAATFLGSRGNNGTVFGLHEYHYSSTYPSSYTAPATTGFTIDVNDDLLFLSLFEDTEDFGSVFESASGPDLKTAHGGVDLAVSKMDVVNHAPLYTGTLVFGGLGDEVSHKILGDGMGNLYLTGVFEGTVMLGDGSELTATEPAEVFLLKMEP